MLFLREFKDFGDMKKSIPKPEEQKRYLSREAQGGQRLFSCKSKYSVFAFPAGPARGSCLFCLPDARSESK